MPMSSGGYAASSSGCATRPKAREIGSSEYAGPTQHSLPIGYYVTATAEHREPCDSRGSCTVLERPEVKFLLATRQPEKTCRPTALPVSLQQRKCFRTGSTAGQCQ